MVTYHCPQGHTSTESDYCSECGTKIADSPSVAASVASTTEKPCPDCGTPHDRAFGSFCEICGYNFLTGAHGELPIESKPVESKPIAIDPPTTKQEPQTQRVWELTITIDPTLRHADSPEPPIDFAPRTIVLDQPTLLIGRTSQARAIAPEIALDFDSAISHRHAIINWNDNGSFTIRDIGSSNGTSINGIEIATMIDITLNPSDEITLGHWTKLTITQKA